MSMERCIRPAFAVWGFLSVALVSGCGDECCGPPPTGRIVVTVTTSGADLDPDGYTIGLDGYTIGLDSALAQAPVSINGGSTTFPYVPLGQHTVWITDLAANCTVSGPTSVRVTVASGATVQVSFAVSCVAFGAIGVTATTGGADVDPDGYTITVDGGVVSQALPANGGAATFAQQAPGSHTVEINGVAANCSVSGQTLVTVTVASGATAEVAFAVSCAAFGAIRVTATTSGADLDPDGYTIMVDGGVASQALPANGGAATFAQQAPGSHPVEINGVAANCSVSGQTSVTVTVASGATAEVAFAVSCVAFGAIQVTATTSGADLDPDGYTVGVEGQSAQALPTNGGAVTFSQVAPGPRVVTLGGVRANCTVLGSAQVTVTVPSGATAAVEFAITCVQIMPTGSAIAFVRNSGGNREVFLVTGGSLPLNLTNSAGADGPPVWSPDGTKNAFVSDRDGNTEIYVMNPDGTGQRNLTHNGAAESSPAWSPDGARIAFVSNRDGNAEVYVMNADGTGPVNLTSNLAAEASPAWAPDGKMLAFVSDRDGNQEIYLMHADGSHPANLSNNAAADMGPVWSLDGSRIAFESGRDGNSEIYLMNPNGTGQVNLTNSPAADGSPAWSPDGRRIVFASGGIAVINADGTGFARLITNTSCGTTTTCTARTSSGPVWSPDGSKIAFQWVTTFRGCFRFGCRQGTRSGISVMSPDGSMVVALVDDPVSGNGSPAWRPR